MIDDMILQFSEHPTVYHLCIVDEYGKLEGMINRKRFFQAAFSHHVSAESRVSRLYELLTAEKAGELMTSGVVTVTEDEDINEAIKKMIEHDLFEIPVVDHEGHILGFLTSSQILIKLRKEEKLTKEI